MSSGIGIWHKNIRVSMTHVRPRRYYAGSLEVLRNRNFRLLWAGQTSSALGNYVLPVGLPLLALARVGGATEIGLLVGVRALGAVVSFPFSGIIEDRLPRVTVMICSDIARLLCVILLGSFPLSTPVWPLLVVIFVNGVAEGTFYPAYKSLIPKLVSKDNLQAANGLGALATRLCMLCAPGVAVLLIPLLGIKSVFWFDAVTFTGSLVSLWLLARRLSRRAATRSARETTEASRGWEVLVEFRAGFREVTGRRWIAVLIATDAVCMVFAVAPLVVGLPAIAHDHLGGVAAYSLLLTGEALGAIVGAFVSGIVRTQVPGVVGRVGLLFLPMFMLGLAMNAPIPVLWVLYFCSGLGQQIFGVFWLTAVQTQVPAERVGRVLSMQWFFGMSLLPLAQLAVGPVGNAVGLPTVMLYGGLVTAAMTVLPLALSDVRRLACVAAPAEPRNGP
jgi:Major Facilitator Superfamily